MGRSPAQRAAAWLVTGPVGHLAAGLVDWVAVLAPVARERARGTLSRFGRRTPPRGRRPRAPRR